jgi:hypothetical protein
MKTKNGCLSLYAALEMVNSSIRSFHLPVIALLIGLTLQKNPLISQKPVIVGTPNRCNGYLVLDDADPTIEHFEVYVIDRGWNSNGIKTETVLDKVELWNTNYYYIDDKFRHLPVGHELVLDIKGLNQQGMIVYDSPYVPSYTDNPGVSNTWFCTGCDYAYSVVQSFHSSGEYQGYTLWLDYGYGMMWWGNNELPIPGQNSYYMLPGYPQGVSFQDWYINSITDDDLANCEEHVRPDCSCISSSNSTYAIGYKKSPNTWVGSLGELVHPPTSFSDLDEAIEYINQNGNIPFLYCDPIPEFEWDEGDQEGSYPDEEIWNWLQELWWEDEELVKWGYHLGNPSHDHDFWDLASGILEGYGEPSELNQPLIARLADLHISEVDQDQSENVYFSSRDLVAAQEDPSLLNFSLSPGLYHCVMKVKNHGHRDFYFDVANKISNDCNLCDLANIVLFPVPVISNEYSFHLTTACRQAINYALMDSNGNVLLKRNYEVGAGHNEDHKVVSECVIPDGLLFNKFIFSDGSEKIIATTKITN